MVVATVSTSNGEAEKQMEERERKWGEKKIRGPVTVINWDPHEFSPDLNPDWIQKQANG